mmetsp:Transcript_116269/g.371035  ORF Transcript_116269/g.371035 Transcript_116269/m.371035 type:complete len:645 (+) Transcript_116269:106-2040(+)
MQLRAARSGRLRSGALFITGLAAWPLCSVLRLHVQLVFALAASRTPSWRHMGQSSCTVRAAEGKPLELLTLPELDTYTSKGVLPAPKLELPDGKRSVFDGLPLRQVDSAAGADDVQVAVDQLLSSLVGKVGPLDLVTAALLLCVLTLGLLDTSRRWIDYAAEEVGWALFSQQPHSVAPRRRVPGGTRDVELAQASSAESRRLAEFVESAKPGDQLRALAAADAALTAEPRLQPLVAAIRSAASASAASEEGLPSMDGEWECLCDYFATGELVEVPMRLQGSIGRYNAGGGTHSLHDIAVRREGSLFLVSFRWRNAGGGRGRGTWMLSGTGDCVDGTWSQDGLSDGPWVWIGVKKKVAEPSVLVGRAPPVRTAAGASAAASAAAAIAEVVDAVANEPAASREVLACAWDSAVPRRVGGTFSQSAVLPRLWFAAGSELRTMLGLTYSQLVPSSVSSLATSITFAGFALVALVLARALAVGLGSSSDAATWASFAAATAVVLDVTVPARRDRLRDGLRSPEAQASRSRRLQALCRWADSGALRRSGSSPRDEVIAAVRRGVPEFRTPLDGDDDEGVPGDAEVERMLRIWHPALKRRVLRGLAGVQAREPLQQQQQQQQQDSGDPSIVPAVITYENLSVAPQGGAIWR